MPPGKIELSAWRLPLRVAVLAVTCLGALQPAVYAAPPARIIFDTDMMTDCDDAGALALLHVLADQGEVEILGTVVCTLNPWAAPCVDAINTYYGRPDLPVGTLKGTDGVNITSKFAQGVAQGFPQDTVTGANAADALKVYRQLLANETGKDVVIITLGYMTNLAHLLNSPADEISPLTGAELIQQRVKTWVCMGGNFPNDANLTSESDNVNFRRHPASVIDCVTNWPGEIEFVGREIGHAMRAGARLNQTPTSNPVRRAYELYFNGTVADRHCADIVAVLYGARGLSNYWTMEDTGAVQFTNASAWFRWVDPPDATNQAYIKALMSPTTIQELMEDYMLYAPGSGQAAPSAGITSPMGGAWVPAGQPVNIVAAAADPNGAVAKVEFYSGMRKLGERTASPYTLAYSGLAAGEHRLSVKVTDDQFKTTTSAPVTVNVGQQPPEPAAQGTGLTGQYYDNADLTNLKLTRTDATVNFNWAQGAPSALVGADTFSVRWTGAVLPPHASGEQAYTFYTNTNDGVRLWLNGELLMDDWIAGPLRENQVTISLAASTLHTITLEFFENTISAQAELRWSSTGISKQIISEIHLFPQANQAPVAVNDVATVYMELPALIPVLVNDADADRALLPRAILAVSGGVPGSTVGIEGENVRYTPPDGFIGVDVLGYTLTDGQATSTTTITVTVLPWAHYATFAERYFPFMDPGETVLSGWDDDADGDGLANGLEYALMRHPLQAEPGVAAPAVLRDGVLVLTYTRRKAAAGVEYVPQVSSNLAEWMHGPEHVTETVVAEDELAELVEARDLHPGTGDGNRYMSLKVNSDEF